MTTPSASATLPDALALAAWPQWHVNGHNLDAALRFVATHHTAPTMRALAAEAVELAASVPIVRGGFESAMWAYEREARTAQGA